MGILAWFKEWPFSDILAASCISRETEEREELLCIDLKIEAKEEEYKIHESGLYAGQDDTDARDIRADMVCCNREIKRLKARKLVLQNRYEDAA
jgi:hypothetical protein